MAISAMKKKAGKPAKATGIKEKSVSIISSASGFMGVFGSWTVCHNVCTAAIAILAVIGVTVTGMPLLFLQSVAVPLWTAAVILFAMLLFLKLRKMGCLSGRMLTLNAGLVVFGTPLQPLQQFSLLFRIAGSVLIVTAIVMFVSSRVRIK